MQSLDMKVEASAIDLAACRATLYSALALGFRAPAEKNIARLIAPPDSEALMDAARLLDPNGRYGLVVALRALSAAGRAGVETLTSMHVELFGHTARGAVPPYETEYGNGALFQQPQELGDLMGFYRAFGLTMKSDEYERPDHVSCECEFLAFLALKSAYALEHSHTDMLEETGKAERLFLRDHLGRFAPAFAHKLKREDRVGFYAALGELCLQLAAQESARLAVTLGGTNLPLRPADNDAVPMACGSGTECAAMPGAGLPEGAETV